MPVNPTALREAIATAYADPKLKLLSLREMAERLGCSHEYLRKVRLALVDEGKIVLPRHGQGRDGREFEMPKRKPTTRS